MYIFTHEMIDMGSLLSRLDQLEAIVTKVDHQRSSTRIKNLKSGNRGRTIEEEKLGPGGDE